jgi:hypothetical protein
LSEKLLQYLDTYLSELMFSYTIKDHKFSHTE